MLDREYVEILTPTFREAFNPIIKSKPNSPASLFRIKVIQPKTQNFIFKLFTLTDLKPMKKVAENIAEIIDVKPNFKSKLPQLKNEKKPIHSIVKLDQIDKNRSISLKSHETGLKLSLLVQKQTLQRDSIKRKLGHHPSLQILTSRQVSASDQSKQSPSSVATLRRQMSKGQLNIINKIFNTTQGRSE